MTALPAVRLSDSEAYKNVSRNLGKPSAHHSYHNTESQVMAYILRWDTEDGKKEYRPFFWNGGKWVAGGFPEPRPLYNLNGIASRLEDPIIICEGEKAADAASQLFPKYVATTTMNGAMSPHKTDFAPVKGRHIVLALDHDEAGLKYGEGVYKLCKEAEYASVRVVNNNVFSTYEIQNNQVKKRAMQAELIKGFDLADALSEGWTSDLLSSIEQELIKEKLPWLSKSPSFKPVPDGFKLTDRGLEFKGQWICGHLVVKAHTRNEKNEKWGRLIEIIDPDGIRKNSIIPAELISGNGDELTKKLVDLGLILILTHSAKKHICEYLMFSDPGARITCIDRLGWLNHNYVLPHKTYGHSKGNQIVFAYAEQDPMRGSLKDWQENVGRFVLRNDILLLATCTAFSGPLLYLLGEENFAIHLSGSSSTGKTTALRVAESIVGKKMCSWRTTDNAAESMAKKSNDGLLILDELGEVDARAADNLAYMLGNGSGKARANKDGNAKDIPKFRLIVLSSGEIGMDTKLTEINRSQRAGQAVRFIEISSDAGEGHGVFNHIHDFKDGNEFSVYLKKVTKECYGSPLDAFLTYLTENLEEGERLIETIQASRDQWIQRFVPANAGGQIKRGASKFSLLAAVGNFVTSLEILPKDQYPESIDEAFNRLFQSWCLRFGKEESHETHEIKESIVSCINKHGSSRFENVSSKSLYPQKIFNRLGFKKFNNGQEQWDYFFHPESFYKEILKGKDKRTFLPKLVKEEIILGCQKRNSVNMRVEGYGQQRLIHVHPNILTGGI